MTSKIQVAVPDITPQDIKAVTSALKAGWISGTGPYVSKFEKEFANKVSGTQYAVAVNSGSSALHLALLALGIGPGDEVIMPTFTMIATANAVSLTGAAPVLIDADLQTWNINPDKIEEKISKRTKAIIAVHIYGLPCNMRKIMSIAKKHGLLVVEDAAEAQGAIFNGKKTGGIGDIASFSLYANKIITTGEGGMVTTNNSKLAILAAKLRNNGFEVGRRFWHKEKGFGYRLSSMQAALGLSQLKRFNTFLKKRRENARLYKSFLKDVPGVLFPQEPSGYKNCYWVFGIVLDPKIAKSSVGELRGKLNAEGIETREFFVPIHLQPIYKKGYSKDNFPVSEFISKNGFYLPSSSKLKKTAIEKICGVIRKNMAK